MATQDVQLGPLSKRAVAALAAACIADYADEFAADRLLAVHGCGRRTLREINTAVANATGKPLGGFDRLIDRNYDPKATMTTDDAAQAMKISADEFLALARRANVIPSKRKNGRIWSEWDLFSVRKFVWRTST
jgi:hypothetical protein